jgi:hypothetical protein
MFPAGAGGGMFEPPEPSQWWGRRTPGGGGGGSEVGGRASTRASSRQVRGVETPAGADLSRLSPEPALER